MASVHFFVVWVGCTVFLTIYLVQRAAGSSQHFSVVDYCFICAQGVRRKPARAKLQVPTKTIKLGDELGKIVLSVAGEVPGEMVHAPASLLLTSKVKASDVLSACIGSILRRRT